MPTDAILAKKILVFLPQAAAHVIITQLTERGHGATAVSTVPEAFDALRSDCYAFAITTRPDIALLRNIRAIPVVNLEVFFHSRPLTDGPLSVSKQFDSRAFMDRIEFLAQSALEMQRPVEPITTIMTSDGKTSGWWSRAKIVLRLAGGEGARHAS